MEVKNKQLPSDWKGIFWEEEAGAQIIFDYSPEEFIEWANDRNKNTAEFLVAGALFDLYREGFNEQDRYNQMTLLANDMWPERPWYSIPDLADEFEAEMRIGFEAFASGDGVKMFFSVLSGSAAMRKVVDRIRKDFH